MAICYSSVLYIAQYGIDISMLTQNIFEKGNIVAVAGKGIMNLWKYRSSFQYYSRFVLIALLSPHIHVQ